MRELTRFRRGFLFLFAVFLVRLYIIHVLPLTGDEAYYWEWSRHLAAGYHDHPPLVGWLIAVTGFLGKSSFWVRFPGVLLSFFSSLFLFLLTRNIWESDRQGLAAVVLENFIPIFAVCFIAIFPDSPLVFSWTFFLWAAWLWLRDERYWVWMGIALGLAALSKLMGLFLLPSFLLFLWLAKNRPEKPYIKRISLWKSVFLGLIIISPFFAWNVSHHFEPFSYQAHHRLTHGFSLSLSLFLNYASLQLVALSPILFFVIGFTALFLFQKSKQGDDRARFLLVMALPIHVFFALTAFFTRVGLHWALPGYISILAAVPAWIESGIEQGKRWVKPFFAVSLATACIVTIFIYTLLRWPETFVAWIASRGLHYQAVNHGKTLKSQTMAEILSYTELGEKVHSLLEKMNRGRGKTQPAFALTDSYSLSSIIGFYAATEPKTILFTSTGGDFDRWNHFENFKGGDALYIDTQPIGSRPDIDAILHRAFTSVVPLNPLMVKRGIIDAGNFYFAECKDLIHPDALRPQRSW